MSFAGNAPFQRLCLSNHKSFCAISPASLATTFLVPNPKLTMRARAGSAAAPRGDAAAAQHAAQGADEQRRRIFSWWSRADEPLDHHFQYLVSAFQVQQGGGGWLGCSYARNKFSCTLTYLHKERENVMQLSVWWLCRRMGHEDSRESEYAET